MSAAPSQCWRPGGPALQIGHVVSCCGTGVAPAAQAALQHQGSATGHCRAPASARRCRELCLSPTPQDHGLDVP